MAVITLGNESLRLHVDPEAGASVLAFHARKGDDWLPLMPDTRKEGSTLSCASFLMIPYSNRIENGAFSFQGKHYQLEHGEHHAIHGDVRTRPWLVEEAAASTVRCTFRSADHENVNWPWPFEARAEYRLAGNVFSSRLVLWNRGQSDMPAGMGWHPYFNRALTRKSEPVHLCLRVAAAYPDANGNRIPSGPAQPLTAEQDFSVEKPLASDHFLDTCFQGYDGDGYIGWPASGVRLLFECSAECTHLIVYNPAHSPSFAVEPVTNANNGVNLYGRGWPDSGVVPLAPNESLEARFDMRVEVGRT